MYIVILKNGVRHSAWSSMVEAKNQVAVLKDYGYKHIRIEFDETVVCESGHYYV